MRHRRETERHATGVHAGGTPALPGGPLPITLAPQGARAGSPGRSPCRCGRAVTLGGRSSSFVSLRGSLFFRLFQVSAAPALWCGSFESETKDPFGPMNRTRSRCAASGCPPGSAGVPPAPHWQGLAHLRHAGRLATAPGLCVGRAHAVPAGRVAGCDIAGKLSGTQRECMRAGRPRSRVGRFPSLLLLKGTRAGLPGRSPCRCGRAVTLGGPSSSFVSLRGSLPP